MALHGFIIEYGPPDHMGWRWRIRCKRFGIVMHAPDAAKAERWAKHLSEHPEWRT